MLNSENLLPGMVNNFVTLMNYQMIIKPENIILTRKITHNNHNVSSEFQTYIFLT